MSAKMDGNGIQTHAPALGWPIFCQHWKVFTLALSRGNYFPKILKICIFMFRGGQNTQKSYILLIFDIFA